jgi:hypothetical protein
VVLELLMLEVVSVFNTWIWVKKAPPLRPQSAAFLPPLRPLFAAFVTPFPPQSAARISPGGMRVAKYSIVKEQVVSLSGSRGKRKGNVWVPVNRRLHVQGFCRPFGAVVWRLL